MFRILLLQAVEPFACQGQRAGAGERRGLYSAKPERGEGQVRFTLQSVLLRQVGPAACIATA